MPQWLTAPWAKPDALVSDARGGNRCKADTGFFLMDGYLGSSGGRWCTARSFISPLVLFELFKLKYFLDAKHNGPENERRKNGAPSRLGAPKI